MLSVYLLNPLSRGNAATIPDRANYAQTLWTRISVPSIGATSLQLSAVIVLWLVLAIFQSPQSGQHRCNIPALFAVLLLNSISVPSIGATSLQ